jgi:hypothetical protein
MSELSHYQNRVIDKIYGSLERKEPANELNRLCLLYRNLVEKSDDKKIQNAFNTSINQFLRAHLKSKEEFYKLEEFTKLFPTLLEDFVDEHIDADADDCIEFYLNIHQQIIDKTYKYKININGFESLELIQFVDDDFFDDFIYSSKKKVKFLKTFLKQRAINIETKKIVYVTIKNKEIFKLLERLNLKIDFLKEDVSSIDFINVLLGKSKKNIYLNINNRDFNYLLTKIKDYFFGFSMKSITINNRIFGKTGKLLKEKNLRNAKIDFPSLKDEIDKIIKEFQK